MEKNIIYFINIQNNFFDVISNVLLCSFNQNIKFSGKIYFPFEWTTFDLRNQINDSTVLIEILISQNVDFKICFELY